ncbi:hypothetical protein MNZ23_05620 [Staphylococcus equorum]|uniref:hypothetical protein n=1 Tax=Staphylococcus equorum TaxID=246432 RepID=UPI001F582A35|nr:hypothetical protein [Staphylococcus equorum]UNP87080.1 hypothetical protein MNZ23_05620 [Staphylococcus equorum]
MKIKRKVQKTLPQLIEWVIENDIKNKIFISKQKYYNVGFDIHGFIYFNSSNTMPLDETFTVEVEEEITEDTELDLVLRFISEDKAYYTNPQTMSINTCLEAERDDVTKTHFYIENDNRELVLIWRDGKLVE